MTKNIYELLKDHSAEADKLVEDWAKFGNYYCHEDRTPRERLAIMANTLEGEEFVQDYLNEHEEQGRWVFTDEHREDISNDFSWPKYEADLINTITGKHCEVKEFPDVWFPAFGVQRFKFHYNGNGTFRHKVMHDADCCIVINRSHTKIAKLNLNTLRWLRDDLYEIESFNVINLGGKK